MLHSDPHQPVGVRRRHAPKVLLKIDKNRYFCPETAERFRYRTTASTKFWPLHADAKEQPAMRHHRPIRAAAAGRTSLRKMTEELPDI